MGSDQTRKEEVWLNSGLATRQPWDGQVQTKASLQRYQKPTVQCTCVSRTCIGVASYTDNTESEMTYMYIINAPPVKTLNTV